MDIKYILDCEVCRETFEVELMEDQEEPEYCIFCGSNALEKTIDE